MLLSPPCTIPNEAAARMRTQTQRDMRGISRDKAYSVLQKSGLPDRELECIWRLSDVDGDGVLDLNEFTLAMHLTNARVKAGVDLPATIPPELQPKNL